MAQLRRVLSDDVDDQAGALDGFRQNYEQLGRGRFEGSVWQLLMGGGCLLREAANRSLRQEFVPPEGHLTLAMPLLLQPGARFAGRPLTAQSLMVLGDHEAYELLSGGALELIGLSVQADRLSALAPAKQDWLRRAQRQRHLGLAPAAAWALRTLLLDVADQAEGLLPGLPAASDDDEAALLLATLRQVVVLAMAGDDAPLADHLPRRTDTRQRMVRRAVDYLRAHLHDDIDIAQVCAAACASRRSLQYAFEEMLATTPQAYLRALRLNEARRLLKARDGRDERPIAELAASFGFASASHFTRHYRLMFDELPSQTLRRAGVVVARAAAGG